jgi:surfactin synthase thioesterase subunit/glycosyltransferase involved in cell wall biosynthesis
MKVLLAHNSLYFPSHGGGDKSNRLLMEALAARGHAVQVMARLETFGPAEERRFLEDLARRQTPVESVSEGVVRFQRNGVTVYTLAGSPHLRNAFSKRVEEFKPDVILCSTDDPGALLLELALRYPATRVVYLVRATVAVPFGPDCAFPNASKTDMIGRVDSIIGVSEYVAGYVRQWSGFPAVHVPISLLEPGDYSAMGSFDNEFVLMVNPCAVKGISIFTALAEAMPDVPFAAVPTWGTNPDDLAELQKHANIKLFAPVDDMATLLRRTRVVLVPSVWAEARSRMVVESMIRGIPVIASDVGGLHEAKMGVEYLLPVNPIQRYRAHVDTNMVPVAEVPPQDIAPWQAALHRLLTDREHYEDVSRRSRAAAMNYANTLHAGWLEEHLENLIARPSRLSPAKRRLLDLRIAKSKAKLRLFYFPHAGGTSIIGWRRYLEPEIDVRPIRLPGFTGMRALVEALTQLMAPQLKTPFAFYGHSMGAGVAFELIRSLRRNKLPLPQKLIVSSARAPQLRTNPPSGPDPSDDDLLREVERLSGAPPDLLQLTLPDLRADTHLYRHYVYQPDAPLDIPIHAHLGLEDPSLETRHMEVWNEQTTANFSLTTHPGGHFFMREKESAWAMLLKDSVLPARS